jgi:hypothetical protein
MRIFILIAVAVTLCGGAAGLWGGCSSSSEPMPLLVTNNVTNTTVSATGNWRGTFDTNAVPFNMTLVDNGGAISGSYAAQGWPGEVTGQVTGNTIDLTVTAHTSGGDVVAQWVGIITADMKSATGAYNILSGGGGSGAWQMAH